MVYRFLCWLASSGNVVADFRKKVRGFPPAVAPEGAKTALFFENRRQGLERRYLTEKLKGGTLILSTFWRFWGFPVKTVCQTGLPGCRPAEKTVQHPSGVISEALPRVCALDTQGVQNTPSEGPLRWPPKGVVPFSLLACILWEASLAHRFHRKSQKSPKVLKKGVTPPPK